MSSWLFEVVAMRGHPIFVPKEGKRLIALPWFCRFWKKELDFSPRFPTKLSNYLSIGPLRALDADGLSVISSRQERPM
jgi:hypothetical protein